MQISSAHIHYVQGIHVGEPLVSATACMHELCDDRLLCAVVTKRASSSVLLQQQQQTASTATVLIDTGNICPVQQQC